MRFDGAEIAVAVGGVLHDGPAPGGLICTDTRSLSAGDWFLALVGDRFDGHNFASSAAEAGAAGAVFSRPIEGWDRPWVEVEDTSRALQDLGRAARARLKCPVVGLTGSSGKTTTRTLIALALRQLGSVHQTVGNLNNHLGVPLTLVASPEAPAAVVVEMGTSGPNEIELLQEIGSPNIRLVVNVGPAHLEELGGLDGVALEKGALFRGASEDDVLLVNLDDPRVVAMPGAGRRITWGRSEGADIRLVSHEIDAATWSATVGWKTPQGEVWARLPDPAPHVALNAAAALAAAHALGLDLAVAACHLEAYEPVGMRLAPVELPGGAVFINDAYNANPDSMRASLQLLARLEGRRTAVLGDMLELGEHEAEYHQEIVQHALSLGLERVVFVGPRMARAAKSVGAEAVEDPEGLGRALAPTVERADRILVKASRGMRLERVLEELQTALGGTP